MQMLKLACSVKHLAAEFDTSRFEPCITVQNCCVERRCYAFLCCPRLLPSADTADTLRRATTAISFPPLCLAEAPPLNFVRSSRRRFGSCARSRL
eukprot:610922-Pleurochrysis_carterae.AAC.1